jgi:hypothetical protein
MDKLILFLTIIAWVIGILSTLYGGLLLFWGLNYPGSLEETFDKMKGYTKTFNPKRPLLVALICWAFIITFW